MTRAFPEFGTPLPPTHRVPGQTCRRLFPPPPPEFLFHMAQELTNPRPSFTYVRLVRLPLRPPCWFLPLEMAHAPYLFSNFDRCLGAMLYNFHTSLEYPCPDPLIFRTIGAIEPLKLPLSAPSGISLVSYHWIDLLSTIFAFYVTLVPQRGGKGERRRSLHKP